LKAKAQKQIGEGKLEAHEKIDELEQKTEQTKGKLKQLADAAENTWGEVKDKIENAKDDLIKSIKKLFSS